MREREREKLLKSMEIQKYFMQIPATSFKTRGHRSQRAARLTSHPLYARVNAKLKMSAMGLLSDFFSLLFIDFFFFSCRSAYEKNDDRRVYLWIYLVYMCVCIVQTERPNLEEKPFCLPTDSL